jgi:hypothetical protein
MLFLARLKAGLLDGFSQRVVFSSLDLTHAGRQSEA